MRNVINVTAGSWSAADTRIAWHLHRVYNQTSSKIATILELSEWTCSSLEFRSFLVHVSFCHLPICWCWQLATILCSTYIFYKCTAHTKYLMQITALIRILRQILTNAPLLNGRREILIFYEGLGLVNHLFVFWPIGHLVSGLFTGSFKL